MAANVSATSVVRYCALILDTSGSMAGTPCTVQKQAAIKFCESLLAANGENYVAIVNLNSVASIGCNFTDDIDVLKDYVNGIPASGGTNIYESLIIAESLMQSIDTSATTGEVIRNIVLCSDGLPEHGPTSADGPYTSSDQDSRDFEFYKYANAVYDMVPQLKDTYNLYTLVFFHSLNGRDKALAQNLMTHSQNSGYYEVTDPNELEFTFGEIADDITRAQMRDLYIKQHLAYYTGNFKAEVKKITVPDKDGYVRENTNYFLGNLVLDAVEDSTSLNYNIAQIITDSLNLNFDFFEGAVSNYDLILADIVTSSYYKDVLKEAYMTQAMDSSSLMLSGVVEYGFKILDELAKRANVSTDTLQQEWQALAQTLDQMSVTKNPDEYARLFGECSLTVDKYIKVDDQRKFLESINGTNGFRGEAISATIGAVVGATIETASQMMTYYACYDAYCTASDTFKEVLVIIAYYANSFVTIGSLDERYYCASLIESINNFLENSSEDAMSAQQIADRFAKEG